ncbi:hypothetical protein [Streptomyces uncialis]|uniref:hypothetical protein n=1 Tax=Streptomyces uncialis TaxID=1048205 RepID=UPI0037B812B3
MTLSPGVTEYQRDGSAECTRACSMLTGVLAAPQHPGPCVLVGHGLLVCVALPAAGSQRWRGRTAAVLSRAPYPGPVAIPDDELSIVITGLVDDLDSVALRAAFGAVDASKSRLGGGPAIATVDPVSPARSPDQKDLPHA